MNKKWNALEIEYNKLQHQYQKDNRTLRDRVIQLEQRNQQQEKKLSILKSNQSKSVYSPTKLKGVQQHLTKDSFKQGDIVKVINNYKGQYGAIRKVYSIKTLNRSFLKLLWKMLFRSLEGTYR